MVDLVNKIRKRLFFYDRELYRYQVTRWDGEEVDRPAKKDLERNISSHRSHSRDSGAKLYFTFCGRKEVSSIKKLDQLSHISHVELLRSP